jgi:hypothetical protein
MPCSVLSQATISMCFMPEHEWSKSIQCAMGWPYFFSMDGKYDAGPLGFSGVVISGVSSFTLVQRLLSPPHPTSVASEPLAGSDTGCHRNCTFGLDFPPRPNPATCELWIGHRQGFKQPWAPSQRAQSPDLGTASSPQSLRQKINTCTGSSCERSPVCSQIGPISLAGF